MTGVTVTEVSEPALEDGDAVDRDDASLLTG
jgi:hypothetical protein